MSVCRHELGGPPRQFQPCCTAYSALGALGIMRYKNPRFTYLPTNLLQFSSISPGP